MPTDDELFVLRLCNLGKGESSVVYPWAVVLMFVLSSPLYELWLSFLAFCTFIVLGNLSNVLREAYGVF
jgi:hypothetical protein